MVRGKKKSLRWLSFKENASICKLEVGILSFCFLKHPILKTNSSSISLFHMCQNLLTALDHITTLAVFDTEPRCQNGHLTMLWSWHGAASVTGGSVSQTIQSTVACRAWKFQHFLFFKWHFHAHQIHTHHFNLNSTISYHVQPLRSYTLLEVFSCRLAAPAWNISCSKSRQQASQNYFPWRVLVFFQAWVSDISPPAPISVRLHCTHQMGRLPCLQCSVVIFLKTELQLSDLSLSKLLLTGIGFLYCNMENYLLGSCWHYKSGAQPCKGAPLWWEWKRCLKRHPWNQTTRPFPCSSQSSLLMLAVLLYASSCLSDRHIKWKLRDPYSVAIIF